MSTVEATHVNTYHTIESDTDRAKFLRRVLRESGWHINARERDDWQIVFTRKIKAKLAGVADVEITVRLNDKIRLTGKWGNQQLFHDSDVVCVPKPTRCWLQWGSVETAARFLLKGCTFMICGSAGSTSSSKHGLAFVSIQAIVGKDHVMVGDQSVYVHGRMVCCGSVE